MPLEPLICRSRYGNVKESYKNRRKFGKSEKTMHLCSVQKNKSINRSIWNIKILKLWQQQIGQLSKETKQPTKL
jgi:hypothetical protein